MKILEGEGVYLNKELARRVSSQLRESSGGITNLHKYIENIIKLIEIFKIKDSTNIKEYFKHNNSR